MSEGWIQLHRSLREWEWFTDVNTSHLFIYCLLRANHKDAHWRGTNIARGQFITSLETLSKETGLSVMQIRTAIKKLELTGELTSKPTNKNRLISISNYNKYQSDNRQDNKPITSQQQTNNKQVTTDNNNNNNKNKNNEITNIDQFEDFWDCYGYKVGKSKAKKAYEKAIKSGVKHESIIQGVRAYQKDCQAKGMEVKFFKHPATWLNGEHWEDEFLEGTASLSKEDEADRIKRIIEGSKKCKDTNLLLT